MNKAKLRKYRTHSEYMIENLRKHPEEMEIYLKITLEEYEMDGDVNAFLLALRTVAEAKGGISVLAKNSKLNRQNLYKMLSTKGNPRFSTVERILKTLGFGLSIHAVV